MNGIVRAFQEEADRSAAGPARPDRAALELLLASFYARGRHAHPRVAVSEQAFGRHVAGCVTNSSPESLADIAAEDLYLACACAGGVPGAATAFERKLGPVIRRAVARI